MKNSNVLVVGGGTAGLITALILKKRLKVNVSVVYSQNIGIVGVGEGSTEHFKDFMEYVGIDYPTLVKECNATLKTGIMFEDWSPKPYFHNVDGNVASRIGQYHNTYAYSIIKGAEPTPKYCWDNVLPEEFLTNNFYPTNQFHFDTFKLNEFLTKKAKEIGITFFEDEILDVVLNEAGDIDYLIGSKTVHRYDFYVDSTGFKRLLMNKLGAKWVSYSPFLKMNSAITFQTPDTDNYALWTLAKAMDYGWMFRIPVWGRHGNGYIFNDAYTTADKAKEELEKKLNFEISVGKTFKFDPGALENSWLKNCVAIGLSGSFVEPLEASSIGTSIQQAYLLLHYLPNYTDKSRNAYNKAVNDILINIRDFVALHYVTNRTDTLFWKEIRNNALPESLSSRLDLWKDRIPIHNDFSEYSDYVLFTEANFLLVMKGLSLFNVDSIQKEFETYSDEVQNHAKEALLNSELRWNDAFKVTHKHFLASLRERAS